MILITVFSLEAAGTFSGAVIMEILGDTALACEVTSAMRTTEWSTLENGGREVSQENNIKNAW